VGSDSGLGCEGTSRNLKRHVILFLAANPAGTDRLALDREARSIHTELKRSGCRDRFEFVTRWAAEPLDVLREVRELKPTVVHFSGHGSAGGTGAMTAGPGRELVVASAPDGTASHGLVFHASAGGEQLVSPEAIAQTLGAAGAPVRLVVLNACFTEPIAKALLAHVDCVVGMTGSIRAEAARSFAIGFYGGLGEHASVAVAFEQGRAAIQLEGLPDAKRPQLAVRAGFDPTELILAAVAPPLRLQVAWPYASSRPDPAEDAARVRGRNPGPRRSRKRFTAWGVASAAAVLLFAWLVALDRPTSPSTVAASLALASTRAPVHSLRRATVLWVDNHPENNLLERQWLDALGATVLLATSNADVQEQVRAHSPDVIISGMTRAKELIAGYALLDSLRQSGIAIPVVIYSSTCQPERRAEARRLGAFGCTGSPSELHEYVLAALSVRPS